MQNLLFTKMNGAGNDFIILDEISNGIIPVPSPLISKMCDRRFGIGADGLMIISESADSDFELRYFNSDGSTGSLCGNGSRCALMYFHKIHKSGNKELCFTSLLKKYHGEIINDTTVKFMLLPPFGLNCGINVTLENYDIKLNFIDTGSPHVVIEVSNILKKGTGTPLYNSIEEVPVSVLGKKLRWLDEFQPDGANINFYEIKNGNAAIRTYERGVEEETYACGTGATAASIIANIINNLPSPVSLVTKSGRVLIVDFNGSGESAANLSLTGPAEFNFNGSISI